MFACRPQRFIPQLSFLFAALLAAPVAMGACSVSGGSATALNLLNDTANPIKLHWVNTSCQESSATTVAAGAAVGKNSYVGHVWRIKDSAGNVLGEIPVSASTMGTVFKVSSLSGAASASAAVYDAGAGTLTIPALTVDGALGVKNVRLQLAQLGSVAVDDGGVSAYGFQSADNSLLLPEVNVSGQIFRNVRLRGPQFTVLGYELDGTTTPVTTLTPVQGLAKYAGSWTFKVSYGGATLTGGNLSVGQDLTVSIDSNGRISSNEVGFNIAYGDDVNGSNRTSGTLGGGSESYTLTSSDNIRTIFLEIKNGAPARIRSTSIPTVTIEASR